MNVIESNFHDICNADDFPTQIDMGAALCFLFQYKHWPDKQLSPIKLPKMAKRG